MDFFKNLHLLFINCCYSIQYVLQTRFIGIQSFLYERKGKIYSCDRYEKLSPLNNRINFVIVNCLQLVGLKQQLPCQWIQKSSFLEQIIENSQEIIHFET